MRKPLPPHPDPVGWHASPKVGRGLAHYFLCFKGLRAIGPICGCAILAADARLFPERFGRRRCKTCDRSAAARGMQ